MGGQNEEAKRYQGERVVVLGRIVGAFGVAGWIKVESYTDPPERLLNYRQWLLKRVAKAEQSEWREVSLVESRASGLALHAKLDEVVTREQAAALRGTEVGVKRSVLPELPLGDYYWNDLIGMEAFTPEGESLGEIVDIRETPAHPLLQLIERQLTGAKPIERWVPFVSERICSVDVSAQRVVLDWQRDW